MAEQSHKIILSLTVTLVVTLRKFFSLLVSVIYFKTYWGPYHWMGTFLGKFNLLDHNNFLERFI